MKKLLITLLLLAPLTTLASEEVRTIVSTGYGSTEKISLSDALISSVEQVIGVMVSAESYSENTILINEQIRTKYNSYVKSYKIISTQKEKETYRTVIEAEVKTGEIKSRLEALKIATIDLNDPEDLYSDLYAKSLSIEDIKLAFVKAVPNMFDMPSLIDVKLSSIDFDKDNIKNGKIPYVVHFTAAISKDKYDAAINDLLYYLISYGMALKGKSYGSLNAVTQSLMPDFGETFEITSMPDQDIASIRKANSVRIASKHNQSYDLSIYEISKNYSETFFNLMEKNLPEKIKKLKCKISLKADDGSILFEDTIPLFASHEGTLAMYYFKDGKKSAIWTYNNLRGAVIKTSSTKIATTSILPYFFINIGHHDINTESLSLGYHNMIGQENVAKIKHITIEFKY